ncbi:MAG TPA: cation:proton antiporter [Candidatus Methylomirabilis sp.]|nr:cation:proton antiporter [Candidatus Methylomirabilis sp.]
MTRRTAGRVGPATRVSFRPVLFALLLTTPVPALAAGDAGHPAFGPILFSLGMLVIIAKFAGLLSERLGQPSVLGELLVGILLGNLASSLLTRGGFGFIRTDPTLQILAEMGVLILLFDVGLEVDLRALVRVGPSAILVGLIGVVAPLLLGWAVAAWLLPDSPTLAHLFIGATLSATSVGITARVLKDLGRMQSHEAQIILGAAVFDDILGLIVLAILRGAVAAAASDGSGVSVVSISGILARAIVFLGVTIGLGRFLAGPIIRLAAWTGQRGILLVFGLTLCFSLAFAAELVGLADIIGAFAAGVMLDPYGEGIRAPEDQGTLSELMHPLSTLFVPLFFVLIGMKVALGNIADPTILLLGTMLVMSALAGKLLAVLGVLKEGVNRLAIGIGMVPRGEVGLVFAGIGSSLSLKGEALISPGGFSAIVVMVLVTTLVAPVGLRWAFRRTS